jgi:hypothetical protein
MNCARIALCAATLLAGICRAESDAARRFAWAEANSRMATARSQADFLSAAEPYRRLIGMGARNGPVFYNLGCALLKAGRSEEALQAFLRAERYLGATPEIRRNLSLAAAAAEKENRTALPWYRPLLFWHYGLPLRVRTTAAVAAFAALWVAAILRALGAKPFAASLFAPALAALVLFGSSAATTIHQEYGADAEPAAADTASDAAAGRPGQPAAPAPPAGGRP